MRELPCHIKSRIALPVIAGFLLAAAPARSLRASETNGGSPALDFARQLNQAFIEVAEKVSAAVVVITVNHREPADTAFLPFEPWPRDRGQQFHSPRAPKNEVPRQEGSMTMASGSGTVVTDDGYILTNNHVVEGAEKIMVRLKDGRRFKARVRGVDPESDLAVIKINATGLTTATMGSSGAAKVGEFVLAVGAPYELDYSVTVGHISAKGRSFDILTPEYVDQDFIQTDASINPGNSGGPLVDLDGHVIGINAMIRGLRSGIGFAIPSDLAKRVMTGLIDDGKFVRSWLGVGIGNLRDDQEFMNFAGGPRDGVLIQQIIPFGPAAKSSLRPADIVVAVDGRRVRTSRELKNEVAYKKVGQVLNLDVIRDGKPRNVAIITEAVPESGNQEPVLARRKETAPPELGLTVKNLTKELAVEFKVEQKFGVIVTDVAQDSVADNGDVQPGDIITAMDRKPVRNLQDYKDLMKAGDPKKGIMVNLLGNDGIVRFTILKENAD